MAFWCDSGGIVIKSYVLEVSEKRRIYLVERPSLAEVRLRLQHEFAVSFHSIPCQVLTEVEVIMRHPARRDGVISGRAVRGTAKYI